MEADLIVSVLYPTADRVLLSAQDLTVHLDSGRPYTLIVQWHLNSVSTQT